MKTSTTYENTTGSEIAIIGMAGRFPGAKSVDKFWQNLRDGVEAVSILSKEELLAAGVDQDILNAPNYVKAGVILQDIDLFDALFFGISPRDAEIMDPQHRLFLETAWEVLESAGYNSETYTGSIGVYAGVGMSSYLLNLFSNPNLVESVGSFAIRHLGNDKDFLTTRISYHLNLKGPSINIQTACSSSLVAVHQACLSLLNGECNMALAGGVTINLLQKEGYLYQAGGVFSPDGHCRAFDARAQGMVSGSGVAIILLKRLVDALSDGDSIHAVIKASAVNNDGSSKAGYMAPSVNGQAAVITEALAMAEIDPQTITYIETHGTGTSMGDPIEIAALTQAFRASTQVKGFCAIGSVKTNIGHLDAAAGIASLIKTVLAIKYKLLPPSLNFNVPNPEIDFSESPFYVNNKLSEWKPNGTLRRAGVSSFGFGGTNAHVIVEEPPAIPASSESRHLQLLMLSAKTNTALETATTNLIQSLREHSTINLADVAYTLQVGRRGWRYRRMVICSNCEEAVSRLETLAPQWVFSAELETKNRPIIFMYPGQGTQYVNMGLELYQTESTFRQHVDYCSELLKPHLGLDLRSLLYPSVQKTEEAVQQLNRTFIAQPVLFVIEYALSKLWMEWGVHPQAMIGQSIGEYVVASLAGVFSLEDALTLVARRGQLIDQLPEGMMLAIPLSEEQIRPFLEHQLSLAAVNSPSLCVVSGPTDAVERLEHQLARKGLGCHRLHTSHAFHSAMMEPILASFAEQVAKIKLNPPGIPYISNVTGTWITPAQATNPNYWAKHLRQTVRFADGIDELLKQPDCILLEVGPGHAMRNLARQYQNKHFGALFLSSLRHAREHQTDSFYLLLSLGKLWLTGMTINWDAFYANERRHRIPLSTYPFERQRYWIEPQRAKHASLVSQTVLEKKLEIANWFYLPIWKDSLLPASLEPGYLAKQKKCWLIFVDELELGYQICKRLEKEGQDVFCVEAGEQFSRVNEHRFAINPDERNDYDALLRELRVRDKTPQMVLHLWSVRQEQQASSPVERFEKSQALGFYSLLFLVQAFVKQYATASLQIKVVMNNVQVVTGEEILLPEKATILGSCKVIPQEYPNITCTSIDIVTPKTGSSSQRQQVDQLMAEFVTKSPHASIAYRKKHRKVQSFELVQVFEEPDRAPQLSQRGVYLITGGLGNIGLVLAEYLAKTVQAKLILTGRSALPVKEDWNTWLKTHDDYDLFSRKIRKLQAIEKLGAEVLVVRADVNNLKQMRSVINEAYKTFDKINGVIHAAGITGERSFCPIHELGRAECEPHFQAKVHGLYVLEEVLRGRDLDFCLLQSSLSSILGGLGFAAYSAANLFMDTFAQDLNQNSPISWLSVNWDGWKIEEGTEKTPIGSTLARFSLAPSEGAQAFERILTMGAVTQVVVSTGNLHARLDQWINLESLQNTKDSRKQGSFSLKLRPALQNPYAAPVSEFEKAISSIWQDLLGIEQVGVNDDFFELGGQSLTAIQISSRVREAFQVELPLSSFFEEPTVASLAKRLEAILNEEADNDGLDKIMQEIESLSMVEVQEALSSEMHRGTKEL